MTLPSELVSMAVRGTTQDSAQGYQQTAVSTLRLCGIRSFQNLSGYMPAQDKKALPSAHPLHPNQTIQPQHLKYLHIILQDHPQMIEEWIQAVCELGQMLPDEYIPYFLELGCEQTHLQKWLKLILSDTTDWLLTQSGVRSWEWYQNCATQSVEELIAKQTKDNRSTIYQISVSLVSEPLNPINHRALNLLRNYTPLWADQIANIFIEALLVGNVTASYDEKSLLIEIVRKAKYQLPLKYTERFLAELRTGLDAWHRLADEIEATFAMRRDILTTIRESQP